MKGINGGLPPGFLPCPWVKSVRIGDTTMGLEMISDCPLDSCSSDCCCDGYSIRTLYNIHINDHMIT